MVAQVSLSTKRKAIADSNRVMFIWVAGMSGVVGICIVVALFLGQQILFHAKVVSEMAHTASVLSNNNKTAGELAKNIVVLETNEALNSSKATTDEKALQVVLDALPADRNALALGASLQQNILTGVSGLRIDKITVDNSDFSTGTESDTTTIPVQIQVSADSANALKDMLVRVERSIRTIDLDTLVLEKTEAGYQMTVQAHAYFEPEKTVKLTDKVVKP